jgi:hypothetical protein
MNFTTFHAFHAFCVLFRFSAFRDVNGDEKPVKSPKSKW